MANFQVLFFICILFLVQEITSAITKNQPNNGKSDSRTLKIAEMVSDGLTPKQKCIKKIAYFFRHRFLRWYSHTHLKKLRKKASRRPPRGRKLKYRKSTRHSSWRFSAPRRRSTWVYRSTRHRRRYPKRAKKKSKSENLFGIKIQKNSLSKKSKAFHLLKNHWRNFLSHRFKSKNREIYAED